MTKTQLVLLGTGTPNANPARSGPALAVVVNDTAYLVDFGPGVVRRAAAASHKGIRGLEARRLCRAFLTHLHSDHTSGYPDLILTPWVLERASPLQVFGPAGLRSMSEHILSAYQEDIRERLEGPEPANQQGYQLNVTEIEAGIIYEDENLSVEAFPANHGSWQAFSYRFLTPDGVIVVTGDTAPYKSMAANYAGCDILVHEVYSAQRHKFIPPEWQSYHARFHTSSRELAQIAAQSKPGLLVLYHQLFWGASAPELVAEIQERYNGKVVSGEDLDVFELQKKNVKDKKR